MARKILITGVSGFIAKHIALQLLRYGYEVVGTVRVLDKADKVRASLKTAGADISRLSFVSADLDSDDGWAEASNGCAGIMHVASPLPLAQPKDRNALIPTARDGALRVLRAAKNVERIVMTSSVAAMMYRPGRPPIISVREDDWSDPAWKTLSAYVVSKTEAEKAAWTLAAEEGFKDRLCVVNPGFVLGPTLDDDIGASLEVIRMVMTGAYPVVPPVSYPVVDVRDVATLHVKALETPEAGGRRLICAAETLSFQEMAKVLKEAFRDRAKKIPDRELPAYLVRLLAMFDGNLQAVLCDLGCVPHADSAYVKALTGIEFRTAREAVVSAARSLIEIKAV